MANDDTDMYTCIYIMFVQYVLYIFFALSWENIHIISLKVVYKITYL